MSDITSLEEVMEKLGVLLSLETAALRRLDHESLDKITDQKIELLGQMSDFDVDTRRDDLAKSLGELRIRLLGNQMLMVHARDLAQGVVDQFTGQGVDPAMPGARLLEVRG